MQSIRIACKLVNEAVESTSSSLTMLLTIKRIESKVFCGTSRLAAATRHIEYIKMAGGFGVAKNSASVIIGSIGATSAKYAFNKFSMTSLSMCRSSGFG